MILSVYFDCFDETRGKEALPGAPYFCHECGICLIRDSVIGNQSVILNFLHIQFYVSFYLTSVSEQDAVSALTGQGTTLISQGYQFVYPLDHLVSFKSQNLQRTTFAQTRGFV